MPLPIPSFARRLLRRLAPAATATRSMDAAAGGRRWATYPETRSSLAVAHAGRVVTIARSRQQDHSNALFRAAINSWESSLVGSGIRISPQHPDAATRQALSDAFERWTDESDADSRTDFYGLQALIARLMVRDGECFVVMETTADGRLRLRVHDTDMVDSSMTVDLGGGKAIIHGIEIDAGGRVVAYHFRRTNPGLPLVSDLSTVRLPASDVLHVFRRDTAGQLRGVPWGAPVLLRLADYDAATDAHLVRLKIAGLLAGFIVNPEGVADPMNGTAVGSGIVDISMEPGELKVLLPGQDVRFSDPANIGAESMELLRCARMEMAAGFGLPMHLFDGDLSEANYSSLREGKVEHRRRAEALQHAIFGFQLLRPVWRRWVTLEALSGRLARNEFTRQPAPWLAATFTPPRSEWVDPKKDVEAEIAAIGANLMSRRQAVAARGFDVEALDREIAADRAREASLGLAPQIPETTP